MQITDIIKDFSTLSDEEVRSIIQQTRRSRTTAKQVTLTKRPTKEKAAAKTNAANALDKLSSKEVNALKELLKGLK